MKLHKILGLLLIMLILTTLMFSSFAFAGGSISNKVGVITNSGISNSSVDTSIKTLGATIVYTIKLVGMLMGVLLLIWFGLKWMTANPNRKGDLKEDAWNYVIGAGLLFGSGTIAQWIYDLIQQIS